MRTCFGHQALFARALPGLVLFLAMVSSQLSRAATNTFYFTYANREALLADGWSFIATLPGGAPRNTENTNPAAGPVVSYDQAAHPGVLRIPEDQGGIWGAVNNSTNDLFRNLSSNWLSLRLTTVLAPTVDFAGVQLMLYQDDDNYVLTAHLHNNAHGGEICSGDIEDGGAQAWSPRTLGIINVASSNMVLRLDRNLTNDNITCLFSPDNTNWTVIGGCSQALTNARIGILTGGPYVGAPDCDVSRLDVITSDVPLSPLLAVQPQHLVFSAVAGEPCTNLQQLRVIAYHAAQVPLSYTTSSDSAWLAAGAPTGSTPSACDVSVNTVGLAPGIYQGTVTCSAPGVVSGLASVTLIVNPAVRARPATWRGGKAGAMTVWVDDSQPTAFDDLSTNGLAGSYMLDDLNPIPSFATNYFLAGMELGAHTLTHPCGVPLDEATLRYELNSNILNIVRFTPEPQAQLISFAWPCGLAGQVAGFWAADYFLGSRGYNLNQLEDASPYDFMNLKSYNSHEQAPYPPADLKTVVDAAVAQGKWFNLVLHATNNDDGAIVYSLSKDIWAATGGSVVKYIVQRDRTVLTNYTESNGHIDFDFYRLPLDGSTVRSFESAIGPQDLLTFQVDVTGLTVYGLTVNGIPVSYTNRLAGSTNLLLFDSPVTATAQTAVQQLAPNTPPVLPAQTNRVINQFTPLVVTNTASDTSLPVQRLSYSLLNPASGAQIDTNGVIQWTPTQVTGSGVFTFTTAVIDHGVPPLGATNRFTVTVNPVTNLLFLPSQNNQAFSGLATLLVTNTATDFSLPPPPGGWLSTNATVFNYATEAALLADGWSFLATTAGGMSRNTEITDTNLGAVVSYDQAAHPGVLRIPVDVGSTYSTQNNSRNSLFGNLPANWVSLKTTLSLAPTLNYQGVNFAWYQDDDNFVEVTSGFSGGQTISLNYEVNATSTTLAVSNVASANVVLRLDRNPSSGSTSGFYSLDGINWVFLGKVALSLSNACVGVIPGGSPFTFPLANLPNCDLSRLEIITASAAPPLSYTLTVTNLLDNSPVTNATINANGVISWTPTAAQPPGTYTFTTVVSDGIFATRSSFNVLLGTAPPPPRIASLSVSNQAALITWTSVSGQTYRVQYKDSLSDTNWLEAAPDLMATGPTTTTTNALGTASRRFYRMRLLWP